MMWQVTLRVSAILELKTKDEWIPNYCSHIHVGTLPTVGILTQMSIGQKQNNP